MVPLAPRGSTKRYMSVRAPWFAGSDIPQIKDLAGRGKPLIAVPVGAHGGHVYSQAGLAVCQALADSARERGLAVSSGDRKLGLHVRDHSADTRPQQCPKRLGSLGLSTNQIHPPQTIHGFFTAVGLPDRPFVYEVVFTTLGRSFTSAQVSAYQPRSGSTSRDHFPVSDAEGPLGPACFVGLVSLKLPQPHCFGVNTQEPSAQSRFASILGSRPPQDWPPAPRIDLDVIEEAIGPGAGTFPIVDMKKVDMRAWNAARPPYQRRELILYRLIAPLPAADPDAHILAHAYEADRNGLLMVANHVGFSSIKQIASLSYSFTVHVNGEEAVMQFGEDQWWIQEWEFARSGGGRAFMVSKIWSPAGVHVATEYQDGLCIAQDGFGPQDRKGKL